MEPRPFFFERGLEVSSKRAASSSTSSEGEAHAASSGRSLQKRNCSCQWLGTAWMHWQSQIDLPCQVVQYSRVKRVPLSYANRPRFRRVQRRSFKFTGCRHRSGGEGPFVASRFGSRFVRRWKSTAVDAEWTGTNGPELRRTVLATHSSFIERKTLLRRASATPAPPDAWSTSLTLASSRSHCLSETADSSYVLGSHQSRQLRAVDVVECLFAFALPPGLWQGALDTRGKVC